MGEPIMADYRTDGTDWSVTVTGLGKELTGTATGIIAARDRADQLVEQLAPGGESRVVVHRLNGDAVEFTTVYLTARLTRPEAASAPTAEQQPSDATTSGGGAGGALRLAGPPAGAEPAQQVDEESAKVTAALLVADEPAKVETGDQAPRNPAGT